MISVVLPLLHSAGYTVPLYTHMCAEAAAVSVLNMSCTVCTTHTYTLQYGIGGYDSHSKLPSLTIVGCRALLLRRQMEKGPSSNWDLPISHFRMYGLSLYSVTLHCTQHSYSNRPTAPHIIPLPSPPCHPLQCSAVGLTPIM